jgi:hypothetical protein
MKHPGHTYGGFVPAISERGMTSRLMVATEQGGGGDDMRVIQQGRLDAV